MSKQEKRTLEINVFGNLLKIVTDESEEYVYKLVSFLNKRMDVLAKNVKIASNAERMILVTLSIADEHFKLKEDGKHLAGSESNFSSLINQIDKALAS